MHGDISSDTVARGLTPAQINSAVREVLDGTADKDESELHGFLMGGRGPLGYRGYFPMQNPRPDATVADVDVDAALRRAHHPDGPYTSAGGDAAVRRPGDGGAGLPPVGRGHRRPVSGGGGAGRWAVASSKGGWGGGIRLRQAIRGALPHARRRPGNSCCAWAKAGEVAQHVGGGQDRLLAGESHGSSGSRIHAGMSRSPCNTRQTST